MRSDKRDRDVGTAPEKRRPRHGAGYLVLGWVHPAGPVRELLRCRDVPVPGIIRQCGNLAQHTRTNLAIEPIKILLRSGSLVQLQMIGADPGQRPLAQQPSQPSKRQRIVGRGGQRFG